MQLAAGQILQGNKYILQKVLGQGGFGVTYQASHMYLDQPVVIKTLQPNLATGLDLKNLRQRFLREARHLARCQHPHIVRVLDFFEEDGGLFMVMDYVPGQTLDEVVSPKQPLAPSLALQYIRQIGRALVAVHGQGLLHRDVKPQNIIRRQGTNSVVLIDFGIAREQSIHAEQVQTGIFTDGYAPLEQYLPQSRLSPATDVYSLAATLYFLLGGNSPVAAPLRNRVRLPSLKQWSPEVPPALEVAILRGLEIEADARPQTVQAWLELLPEMAPPPLVRPETRPAKPSKNQGKAKPMSPSHSSSGPHPAPRSLLYISFWAGFLGAALGLGLRLGILTALPMFRHDQSFPPQPNWPVTVTSPSP